MNKTVFITGGSNGIGKATAQEFAKAGYKVIITYFTSENSARKLENDFGIHAVCCDVKNVDDVKNAFNYIHKNFGKIGTLINCAGVALPQSTVNMISGDDYDKIFDTNVKGVFNVTKEVISDMLDLGGGAIVNVSSIWGLDGGSCEVVYSASKGAVTAFTKALAKELAPSNIRVNEVAPGFIETDMNSHLSAEDKKAFCENVALSRIGRADEVAKVIYFLASENASYITAQTIRVDGGIL